jgi:hypothetical protein
MLFSLKDYKKSFEGTSYSLLMVETFFFHTLFHLTRHNLHWQGVPIVREHEQTMAAARAK